MKNKIQNKVWWEPALEIFFKISGWIAIPIILSLFLGKYLDNKYDTAPWLFLGLTAIAFAISTIGIIRESMAYIKNIEKENPRQAKNDVLREAGDPYPQRRTDD